MALLASTVILLLVFFSKETEGFTWTDSLPPNATVRVCVGDNASLPWTFNTSAEETVQSVQWFHSDGRTSKLIAAAMLDSFLKTRTRIEFLPNAGLELRNMTSRDFGAYTVRVNIFDKGIFSREQTARIALPDRPVLAEGRLQAEVLPATVTVDRRHHVQLSCGRILNHELASLTVTWTTPTGERIASSSGSKGVFYLTLGNPVEGGTYSCRLEQHVSPGLSCLLRRNRPLAAFVHVDEMASRMLVLEAGLQDDRKFEELPVDVIEQMKNLSSLVPDLTSTCNVLEANVTVLDSNFTSLRSDFTNFRVKVNSLKSDVTTLKSDVTTLKSDVTTLKSDVTTLKSDVTTLKSDVSTLKSDAASFGSDITVLKSDVNALQSDVKGFGSNVASLKSDFTAVESSVTDLKRYVTSLTTQVSSLNAQLDNMTSPSTDLIPVASLISQSINLTVIEADFLQAVKMTEKRMSGLSMELSGLKELRAAFSAAGKLLMKPASCVDVLKYDKEDGVHTLYIDDSKLQVFCDQTTDGGGWAVIQRRQDGRENFYRPWDDYQSGFGDLDREFWLGLDKIHRLTTVQKQTLRVDLQDFAGNTAYAKYTSFKVAGSEDKYRLAISGYSGTAGDSLAYHHDNMFSTYNSDNDKDVGNCAERWHGAWWYRGCHDSNINGKYKQTAMTGADGVTWRHWKNSHISLQKTEMKIRPTV